MNHPNREAWMSYLYHEARAEERASLEAHLRGCPQCESQLARWEGAGRELNDWQLPARKARPPVQHPRTLFSRPVLGWAAAALVLLGAGFAAGRLGLAAPDAEKIRASIAQELRQELDAQRLEDSRAVGAALEKLEARRLADYLSLKKELDTVAVLTDASLRDAQQQLAQLADSTQPDSAPISPDKQSP